MELGSLLQNQGHSAGWLEKRAGTHWLEGLTPRERNGRRVVREGAEPSWAEREHRDRQGFAEIFQRAFKGLKVSPRKEILLEKLSEFSKVGLVLVALKGTYALYEGFPITGL